MSHDCPDCGQVCFCGGDIDDCCHNLPRYVMNCTHWKICETEYDEDDYDYEPLAQAKATTEAYEKEIEKARLEEIEKARLEGYYQAVNDAVERIEKAFRGGKQEGMLEGRREVANLIKPYIDILPLVSANKIKAALKDWGIAQDKEYEIQT